MIVRLPACEQGVGHRRQRTYNKRRPNFVEDHVHTASSTHGTSSRQTRIILPSHLSTAATSAARRRRPHHGSAGEGQETRPASRWPRDSWHRDGPHADQCDESSNNNTNMDIHGHITYASRKDHYDKSLKKHRHITYI